MKKCTIQIKSVEKTLLIVKDVRNIALTYAYKP